MNMKKLVVICIVCLCIAAMPAIAQENNTTTNGNETNVTTTPTHTTEPTVLPTTNETNVTETATPVPTEAKLRVGPTVTLRPVIDVIDKSQDGLVELYMNNPSVNDVTLTADVQVSVPSGVHVYGEGFGYGAAAGTVAGTFTVPPGTVRTIHINIKADKIGDFNVHFTGLYWLGDEKDTFQQISLTHPLTVKEPSIPLDKEPTSTDEPNEQPLPSGLFSVIAILVAFGALMLRKN